MATAIIEDTVWPELKSPAMKEAVDWTESGGRQGKADWAAR